MNKSKLVLMQIGRVILALLSVFWAISLIQVLGYAFAYPAQAEWPRVGLALVVTILPALIYTKLTRMVEAEKARNAKGS